MSEPAKTTRGVAEQSRGRTTSALVSYVPSIQQPGVARQDLRDRDDVIRLVETFYDRAFQDPVIGRFFTEVFVMDLPAHLPIMADFWQTVLFQAGLYRRSALAVHVALHALEPLTVAHFNRWLQLWTRTVDELFAGEKAELAKVQAHHIAGSLHRRVTGHPASALTTIATRPPG